MDFYEWTVRLGYRDDNFGLEQAQKMTENKKLKRLFSYLAENVAPHNAIYSEIDRCTALTTKASSVLKEKSFRLGELRRQRSSLERRLRHLGRVESITLGIFGSYPARCQRAQEIVEECTKEICEAKKRIDGLKKLCSLDNPLSISLLENAENACEEAIGNAKAKLENRNAALNIGAVQKDVEKLSESLLSQVCLKYATAHTSYERNPKDWIDVLKMNGALRGRLHKLEELIKKHDVVAMEMRTLREAVNGNISARKAALAERINYARSLWQQIVGASGVLSDLCRKENGLRTNLLINLGRLRFRIGEIEFNRIDYAFTAKELCSWSRRRSLSDSSLYYTRASKSNSKDSIEFQRILNDLAMYFDRESKLPASAHGTSEALEEARKRSSFIQSNLLSISKTLSSFSQVASELRAFREALDISAGCETTTTSCIHNCYR